MKTKLITLAVIATAASAQAQVANGNFDSFSVSGINNGVNTEINKGDIFATDSFSNWSLINKAKVYVTGKSTAAAFIEADRATGTNKVTQKINIRTAGLYTISFDSYTIDKSPNTSSFNAYIGGVTTNAYKEESDLSSTARSFTANLKVGSYELGFENNASGTQVGTYIDNVRMSTVPEPSSTALLGLGGLALILRRKK